LATTTTKRARCSYESVVHEILLKKSDASNLLQHEVLAGTLFWLYAGLLLAATRTALERATGSKVPGQIA
jgi:hypothetical protein